MFSSAAKQNIKNKYSKNSAIYGYKKQDIVIVDRGKRSVISIDSVRGSDARRKKSSSFSSSFR